MLHVIDGLGGSGGAENRLVEEVLALGAQTEQLVIRLFEPSDLDSRLTDAGIEVVAVGLRAARASYSWPLATWRIARVIRRYRPDVVHTSLFAANLAGQLAAAATRRPVVSTMTVTGDPELRAAMGFKAATQRARALRALGVWSGRWSHARWRAVTEDTKASNCQALGILAEHVTVIHRAVMGERSAAGPDRGRFGLPPGPLVVNVARHAPQKGHAQLIDAFARVAAEVPGAQLAIAGTFTDLTPSLRSQAEDLGVGAQVHLLGFRSDRDVLVASGDVFAFSSRAEGIASAVLEAVAGGLPVVSFDIAPVREVTGPGDLATLVPVGDGDAFAAAIVDVLTSPPSPEVLAERRRWVLDHFGMADTARQVEDLLRRSARPSSARGPEASDRNFEIFDSAGVVGDYADRDRLYPCESVLFDENVKAGDRVLDLGVGTGRTTATLAGRAGTYVALDYAPRMVERFRARFPDLDGRVADAADLSAFADASFDVVVFSFNGIDYLAPRAQRAACLAEMARVLRPGGKLIFSSHNARGLLRLPADGSGPRGLLIAGYGTVRLMARALPSSPFWRGDGYRPDTVRGLVTFAGTPGRICRSAEAVGLVHERTLSCEHPRSGRGFSTPWYYYMFNRPEPQSPR